MKKILLTGGTGFIGGNILNKLSKKFEFTVLIRNKKKILDKNVNQLYFKNEKNSFNRWHWIYRW